MHLIDKFLIWDTVDTFLAFRFRYASMKLCRYWYYTLTLGLPVGGRWGRGVLAPLFPSKIAYVPMFPHVFPYLLPFFIHLLTTYHRHRFPPAKKAPKTKLIKEENRLYVTFNLCETSFQAFERNSQSIRVGWALELTLLIKIGDRHHTTATLSRIGSYMAFRASL